MEDPLAPFAVIVVFLLVTVLAVGVGERIHRPYPVLVSLFGLLLALVPAIPAVRIPPGLILPLFLPPLIYAMAQRTSWRMLVSRRRVIVSLAVVLVLASVIGFLLIAEKRGRLRRHKYAGTPADEVALAQETFPGDEGDARRPPRTAFSG